MFQAEIGHTGPEDGKGLLFSGEKSEQAETVAIEQSPVAQFEMRYNQQCHKRESHQGGP